MFRLKTKCKTLAKQSQNNLRKVFDDATRTDPCACEISLVTLMLTLQRILKMRVRNQAILKMRVRKLCGQETVVSSAFQYVQQPGSLCLVGMQTVVQNVVQEFMR